MFRFDDDLKVYLYRKRSANPHLAPWHRVGYSDQVVGFRAGLPSFQGSRAS